MYVRQGADHGKDNLQNRGTSQNFDFAESWDSLCGHCPEFISHMYIPEPNDCKENASN